jgi:hypothetical protein
VLKQWLDVVVQKFDGEFSFLRDDLEVLNSKAGLLFRLVSKYNGSTYGGQRT